MIVRTPSDLGLFVRSRRKELGLDQRTLAAQAGVSRLWLIEFEQGKPRAEIGLVLRTLLALGIRLDVSAEDSPSRTGARSKTERRAIDVPDIDAIVQGARKRRP